MNGRSERSSERDRRVHQGVRARRGVVLVLFALFLWVIMGIAALVIDQGAARLTQRQLHAATDGVALESMRERDQARNDQELDDYFRDRRRRLRANRMSVWHFHPELVTGLGGSVGEFRGGGAFIDVTHGFGDMEAGGQVLDAGFGVPRMSANYDFDGENAVPINARWGDVVSGSFLGRLEPDDADDLPAGIVGLNGNPFQIEDDKYARTDFAPARPEDAPYADSMVVRLRRTRSYAAETANDSDVGIPEVEYQEGVSTAGYALPYYFGRGTTMLGADADEGDYAPRRIGQTIRATSIGSSRPAVRVSPALPQYDADPELVDGYDVGTAPFVLHDLLWHWQANDVWTTTDGGRTWVTYLKYENGFLWNVDWDSIPAGALEPPRLTRVGDKVFQIASNQEFWDDEKNWQTSEAYAPVFHRTSWTFGSGFTHRIIGFVRVRSELEMVQDPDGPGLIRAMKVTKLGNEYADDPAAPWIAPRNASAIFDGEQADRESLEAEANPDGSFWTWDDMLEAMNRLDRAIHAPVVVR